MHRRSAALLLLLSLCGPLALPLAALPMEPAGPSCAMGGKRCCCAPGTTGRGGAADGAVQPGGGRCGMSRPCGARGASDSPILPPGPGSVAVLPFLDDLRPPPRPVGPAAAFVAVPWDRAQEPPERPPRTSL